ncbi:acyltransferase [Streptomyces sp. AV19]|uniref:acyltransferase family protein n=1 Tax=Streptomyces sp. AV19 TaxID=2793068 RepID=UPI0018FED2AA|nr:acyltransferase [Streptomyces sp. AV19]MBH1939020.1 acyltransferase [Streptomyces sp. AV19]MDG4532461.1 acyltransferase [Streptomyces sp. AV19]
MSALSPAPSVPPVAEPASGIRPAPARVRLDSLTGLRWCAAFLVFCYHFAYEQAVSGIPRHVYRLKELTYAGPSAVSFFFILSGFVLAWSARSQDTAGRFWWRRFIRVYPSHVVTFCLAVIMLIWMGRTLQPDVAAGNLGLIQAWVPNRRDWWFGYNGVSWSLSCEFLFYFTFPFVIPILRRLKSRGLWAVVVAGNLCVACYPFFTGRIVRATGWDAKFLLYILPPVRLAEFVVGISLALLVKRGAWRGPGLVSSLALCAVTVFGLVHVMPYNFHWAACTVVPFTLTIAAAARADVLGEPSPFRNPYIVYLGEISFAFYLVHEMVIFSTRHFFRMHHVGIPLTLHMGLVASLSLLGAVLLHEYVEKPGVRLLSRDRSSASGTSPSGA